MEKWINRLTFEGIDVMKKSSGIGKSMIHMEICMRESGRLYFCRWYEVPNYREEIVIRKYPSGEILEIVPGAWMEMPDGQIGGAVTC